MRHLSAIFFICFGLTAVSAGDWTSWRGPHQNGKSDETNLPSSWSKEGENLLWSKDFGSRATPIVMNDRVYAIGRVGTGETLQERVVCMSLETGDIIWEYRFNVFLTDIVEHRVGNAQLVADPETGYIYGHGVQGLFFCLDKDGKVVWQHSLTEEYGRISGYGGRTHSPILEGDMVIIGFGLSGWGPFGRGLHRVAAMDKMTGDIIWWYSTKNAMLDTTYSVPVVATVNGVRTYMAGMADGTVQGIKVNTGEPIWTYTLSKRGINTSLVYKDGKVFASHSEENIDSNVMGKVASIDATRTGDITADGAHWRIDGMGVGYASPAIDGDLLFVASNKGNLHCIDINTGQQLWEFNYGTAAKGSPTIADGKIYIGEVSGRFHILKYSREGAERLNEVEFLLPDGSPIEIYSSPSIANGRVILATKDSMFCIGSNPQKPGKAKVVKVKQPKPGKAAHLQLFPGEAWVNAGESQKFTARVFDDKGTYIKDVNVDMVARGLKGRFDNGVFKTENTGKMQAGFISAEYNGLKAQSRFRIVPPLPYSEDFGKLKPESPPPGWISSRLKSQVVEMEGDMVLKKMADRMHPAFARMRNYMMPPLEPGYTIQSDMYGKSKKRRFWPDMGLINSRYMLRIMGTTKKPVVRLVSWDPMPRIQKDVEFDWKPDTWYTVKMSYDIEDGKGVVRGKVWLRGEAEPDAWTIEMIDSSPNTGGSPGLYGYSTAISETSPGTEVFYDNVKIYRDK